MDNPLLPANDRYLQAIYDGSPIYSFDFPVYDGASVALYVAGERWSFPTDYSVTPNGLDGGTSTGGGISGLCPALAAQRFPGDSRGEA
jgi:hypothetical protein